MPKTWPWHTDGLTLANLKDVDLTGLQEGQTLVLSGTTFVPGTPSGTGTPGEDGREVEIQKGTTYIQWRHVGDIAWTNLVALADLEGADGSPGTPGTPGLPGYTPIKGVDYFDGAKGDQGIQGIQGVPGVGGDPWTVVKLAAPFTSSLAANTNVTGLFFTPVANKKYIVYGGFLLRTATATVGARPGIAWPTGLTDAGAWVDAPNSATAAAMQIWGTIATANAASTGLPNTTASFYSRLEAMLVVDASPSGDFQITLASETGGTNVTMRAGSYIMYREI